MTLKKLDAKWVPILDQFLNDEDIADLRSDLAAFEASVRAEALEEAAKVADECAKADVQLGIDLTTDGNDDAAHDAYLCSREADEIARRILALVAHPPPAEPEARGGECYGCNGTGYIDVCLPEPGVCFECNGTGRGAKHE